MAKIGKLEIKTPSVLGEFKGFIREYKVMPLAIAFIIGVAATALVKSLVDNIIMPLVTPFIPNGAWESAKLVLGPFSFGLGAFTGAVINFVIIAFVVFMIAKYMFKEEKVSKK